MRDQKIHIKGLLIVFILSISQNIFAQDIPDPESHFGFKPGTDYKIIRWDKIVGYFDILDEKSARIEVVNLGKTTLGNPSGKKGQDHCLDHLQYACR